MNFNEVVGYHDKEVAITQKIYRDALIYKAYLEY